MEIAATPLSGVASSQFLAMQASLLQPRPPGSAGEAEALQAGGATGETNQLASEEIGRVAQVLSAFGAALATDRFVAESGLTELIL